MLYKKKSPLKDISTKFIKQTIEFNAFSDAKHNYKYKLLQNTKNFYFNLFEN